MFLYDGPAQYVGVEGETPPTKLSRDSLTAFSPRLLADLVQYLRDERARAGLEENPVITLTNDNFDDIITTSPLMLVEFYMDL